MTDKEKTMHVEVVFTGLCSLLNVRDNHGDDMVEPSIILVRTDIELGDPGTPGPGFGENPPPGGLQPHHHAHVPFLAYDTRIATVDSGDGFKDLPGEFAKLPFKYLPLPAGVEIVFAGVKVGQPTILRTYDTIVKKDHYWPDAKNQWNRDYVPRKRGKPSKDAVAAFMRFGLGDIGAGRLSRFEWKFKDAEDRRYANQFAEEAIYGFENDTDKIVIRLVDMVNVDHPEVLRTLTFTPIPNEEGTPDQTMFVGNNMEDDIPRAVLRTPAGKVYDGDHFRFLNMVADSTLKGAPFPAVGRHIGNVPSGGSGGTSGVCGPHSSNG